MHLSVALPGALMPLVSICADHLLMESKPEHLYIDTMGWSRAKHQMTVILYHAANWRRKFVWNSRFKSSTTGAAYAIIQRCDLKLDRSMCCETNPIEACIEYT